MQQRAEVARHESSFVESSATGHVCFLCRVRGRCRLRHKVVISIVGLPSVRPVYVLFLFLVPRWMRRSSPT